MVTERRWADVVLELVWFLNVVKLGGSDPSNFRFPPWGPFERGVYGFGCVGVIFERHQAVKLKNVPDPSFHAALSLYWYNITSRCSRPSPATRARQLNGNPFDAEDEEDV